MPDGPRGGQRPPRASGAASPTPRPVQRPGAAARAPCALLLAARLPRYPAVPLPGLGLLRWRRGFHPAPEAPDVTQADAAAATAAAAPGPNGPGGRSPVPPFPRSPVPRAPQSLPGGGPPGRGTKRRGSAPGGLPGGQPPRRGFPRDRDRARGGPLKSGWPPGPPTRRALPCAGTNDTTTTCPRCGATAPPYNEARTIAPNAARAHSRTHGRWPPPWQTKRR